MCAAGGGSIRGAIRVRVRVRGRDAWMMRERDAMAIVARDRHGGDPFAVDDEEDDEEDDERREDVDEEAFVRELPGASNGLDEAVLRALRAVSLGEVARDAGVTSMTMTMGDGAVVIDREAVRAMTTRATARALDAKAEASASVVSRRSASRLEPGSVQSAFQRAVFDKRLHDAIVMRMTEEVARRAEADLRVARRRAQETQLSGRDAARARELKEREKPHKPWFLLETPKEEYERVSKEERLRAAAMEAGTTSGAVPMWANAAANEPTPDPRDESILGIVKHCFYMVQFHPRPIQKVLDYLFGYSPAVDGDDLEEILAYSKGLPVSRGKTPKDLAYVYATNLDKTMGERDKVALKSLIRDVRDEWSTHIRAGFDAVKHLEDSPLDSAEDIRVQNRDCWLRALFPNNDWPTRNEKTYKFIEKLQEKSIDVDAKRVVTSARPVPLALARANLKAKRAASTASGAPGALSTTTDGVSSTINASGVQIHYNTDGIPIVAPSGFFPKTKAALRAEGAAARSAAHDAEQRRLLRRRGGLPQ